MCNYKTFEEVLEFDKNLEKEPECRYLYTCPTLSPRYVEFTVSTDSGHTYCRYWQNYDYGYWHHLGWGEWSDGIDIDSIFDKKWTGIKIPVR